MKVLIWIVSFVVFAFVTAIANSALLQFGMRLGWLFQFIIGCVIPAFIARSLCKKWSDFRAVPIPKDVLEEASQYRGKPEEFAAFMKSCIRSGRITPKQATDLHKDLEKTNFFR